MSRSMQCDKIGNQCLTFIYLIGNHFCDTKKCYKKDNDKTTYAIFLMFLLGLQSLKLCLSKYFCVCYSHNLHHFDQFFKHARHHIASNTFQLYKQHIKKQYESYNLPVANGLNEHNKKTASPQVTKKIKVSDEEIHCS